ncbi:MAG TPA: 3-oxoacyl-ACP reductase family protein [Tepidisphaeraceae bacterium]|jgi:3-oxoacyl-[acyl-carrier protein] reductase|nr:3-oxoacyl-ACP reductase family protein [Tepidisphaeraceae bacterium]
MTPWLNFTGKVILVTGSSRGIGAAIIEAFDQLGGQCIVNYVDDPAGRNKADANAVAQKLKNPLVVEGDVANAASVGAMMQTIQRERGGLDALINNAGILRDRTIKKMTLEEWKAVIDVNLGGTFNCIQQAAAILRPGGRIVNLASVSGTMGIFGQANYASSKAGIMALTRVAARELARQQITVNAIAPGVIDTEMGRSIPEEARAKMLEQIPLGRVGNVNDIADVALFLCSEHAKYITGQVIHVNGGFFMGG